MQADDDVRVVLADYAGTSRQALAKLVAGLPGTALIATIDDPTAIVPTARETRPDVVLVDDRMLRDSDWTADDLDARLIVVGVDDDPGYVARARRIGAEAWVAKERADALLPGALLAGLSSARGRDGSARLGHPAPNRDAGDDAGALPGRGAHRELPADQRDPLAHAQQAEAGCRDRPDRSPGRRRGPRRSPGRRRSVGSSMRTVTRRAPACLTTLVSASWTSR